MRYPSQDLHQSKNSEMLKAEFQVSVKKTSKPEKNTFLQQPFKTVTLFCGEHGPAAY